MSMTRKDFQALAEALGSADDVDDAVTQVANVCARSNTHFRFDTFRHAVQTARLAREGAR